MWSLHVLPVFPWVANVSYPHKNMHTVLGYTCPLWPTGEQMGWGGSGRNNVILPRATSGQRSPTLSGEKKLLLTPQDKEET